MPETAFCKAIYHLVNRLQEELADQAKIDARFFNVLSRIRQKDQSIYDSSAQIYPESESESKDGEEGDHNSRVASRKAHLKDVLAKQVWRSCLRSLFHSSPRVHLWQSPAESC